MGPPALYPLWFWEVGGTNRPQGMLREGAAGILTASLGRRGAPEVEECKDYVTAGPNSCYFSRENFCLYLTYEIWVEAEGWVSERLVVNTGDIGESLTVLGGKRGNRRVKPVAPNGVGWVGGGLPPRHKPLSSIHHRRLGGSCRAAPCCPHLMPTLGFCSPKRSSQDGPPPERDGQRRGHLPVGGLAVPAGHRSLLLPTAVPAAVPGGGQQRVGARA
ncbi:transcription elongation factor A N-terminal and central domain-containing protein 2 isoform X3 [Aquila chrysaetos chrysaetos]|uniref:transcription elongation factor A N-terminal and central domain-containing protein 2 isoform X3 n=1 Tax=Aquila chrysaetos chrysaetos TaxID=223781 RepID=UPI001176F115|nr:transcription elongation factor A N-terminal and central domain-containing protein 2 isoform X3 [Aquila chrysaetos chrysaetos]